jgi:hypothetical protein
MEQQKTTFFKNPLVLFSWEVILFFLYMSALIFGDYFNVILWLGLVSTIYSFIFTLNKLFKLGKRANIIYVILLIACLGMLTLTIINLIKI